MNEKSNNRNDPGESFLSPFGTKPTPPPKGADAREYSTFWEQAFSPVESGSKHGKIDLPESTSKASEWEHGVFEELARQLAIWRQSFAVETSRLVHEEALQKQHLAEAKARYEPTFNRLQREPNAPVPISVRNIVFFLFALCAGVVFALIPNRLGLHWSAAAIFGVTLGAILGASTGLAAYIIRHKAFLKQRPVAYGVLAMVLVAWLTFGLGYTVPGQDVWVSLFASTGMLLGCVIVGLATFLSDDEEAGFVAAHRQYCQVMSSVAPAKERALELQARYFSAMQAVQEAAHRTIAEYRRANREQRRIDRPPPAYFDSAPNAVLGEIDVELPISKNLSGSTSENVHDQQNHQHA